MEVKIDDKALTAIAAKAVFDSFTDERKEALVRDAIQNAFSEKDRYNQRTMLQTAFEDAMREEARAQIKAYMETTDTKDRIKKLVFDGLERMFETQFLREKLVRKLADGFAEILQRDPRDD